MRHIQIDMVELRKIDFSFPYITKEKLDQQAKKVKQQEHRLQDILQKILLSNQKKEMLVKQTKQLSSELNIQEELSKEIFIKELGHLSKDEKRMKKESTNC